MNDFIFQNITKIYFGRNQLQHLGEEAAKVAKKVLLVYGGGSIKRNGLYDKVMKVLKDAGLTVFELPGVEPNPHHSTVNKGAALCKKENIGLVLAVGGGSTVDASKAIAAAAKYEGSDVWDLVWDNSKVTSALPIMVVLTMAATGSEMDCGAVISNVDTEEKLPLVAPVLQPAVSFLDPTNTFTVPAYQTASGSVDIMSHIFDTVYFSRQDRMDMLYRVQDELLKTVVKYAPIALKQPDNYDARANLMWTATWALNGFTFGGVAQATPVHMMEHELSAVYDITHGHGLAILTPRWLTYVLNEETAPQIKRLGTHVFGLPEDTSDMDGAKAAIKALSHFFFDTLGLKSHLSDLGIDRSHFKEMAKKACGPTGKLDGFTVLTPEDVEKIYEMAL